MYCRWHYLLLQAYGFISVSSEQTNIYSNIDSVANFVTALRVDAPTALNITGILGDYENGILGISNSNFDVAKAMCMSLSGCLPFYPRCFISMRLKSLRWPQRLLRRPEQSCPGLSRQQHSFQAQLSRQRHSSAGILCRRELKLVRCLLATGGLRCSARVRA